MTIYEKLKLVAEFEGLKVKMIGGEWFRVEYQGYLKCKSNPNGEDLIALSYHKNWIEFHRVWNKFRDSLFGTEHYSEHLRHSNSIISAMTQCDDPKEALECLAKGISWLNSLKTTV